MTYNIDDAISELQELSVDTPIKPELPDDVLLDRCESNIGFKLPDDYRKFLKSASDVFVGTLSPLIVTESMDSSSDLAVVLPEARKVGVPESWLPICEDNGDYYCLEGEKVRFWSHNGYTNEEWPNLATWIKSVWIDEG